MKLSIEALKERAEEVASQELLETISGGMQESCHDSSFGREGDGNIPTDFKSK
ncbi:MAG TPA: hypothetical protein VFS71_17670 [Flavobacterium sp.]|uniref:hypothetical protein n=1 Tax=Flavobacterium sp. TaxID=239 RepID=UPI002DB6927C|nr:hypothetical protein [Flavobacterium sp.]HEU4791521.1 hypothetical protein [Flavobacterium sp.]